MRDKIMGAMSTRPKIANIISALGSALQSQGALQLKSLANTGITMRDLRPSSNEGTAALQTGRMPSFTKALSDRADSYVAGVNFLFKHSEQASASTSAYEMLSETLKVKLAQPENADPKKQKALFNEFHREVTQLLATQLDTSFDSAYKQLQDAEAMHVWDAGRQPVITLTETTRFMSGTTSTEGSETKETLIVAQIDVPTFNLTAAQAHDYLKIGRSNKGENKIAVEWFDKMEPWQQNYLRDKVAPFVNQYNNNLAPPNKMTETKALTESLETLNNILNTTPSAFRKIPGLANSGDHSIVIFDAKGNIEFESTRARSSIVAPITFKGSSKEAARLTKDNIRQLFQSNLEIAAKNYIKKWGPLAPAETIRMPFLVQTLVSPLIPALEALNSPEGGTVLDQKIQLAQEVIAELSTVTIDGQEYNLDSISLGTNHPINDFRKGAKRAILDEFNAHNPKQAKKFLVTVNQFLDEQNQKVQSLPEGDEKTAKQQQLFSLAEGVAVYQSALHRTEHGVSQGRQLFLSSLEQIMVSEMGGIAHSSCKSGKDRKGMELMHTDAMLLYRKKYGSLPTYNAHTNERRDFLDIMADIFLSNHQQYIADQNAPGCFGLKAVDRGLPEDLQDTIHRKVEAHNEAHQDNPIEDPIELNLQNSSMNKPKTKPGFLEKVKTWAKENPMKTGMIIAGGGILVGAALTAVTLGALAPVGVAIAGAAIAAGSVMGIAGTIANAKAKAASTTAQSPLVNNSDRKTFYGTSANVAETPAVKSSAAAIQVTLDKAESESTETDSLLANEASSPLSSAKSARSQAPTPRSGHFEYQQGYSDSGDLIITKAWVENKIPDTLSKNSMTETAASGREEQTNDLKEDIKADDDLDATKTAGKDQTGLSR